MNQNQYYQQQAPQMAGFAQEVTNAVNQFDYQQTAQQATQEQAQAKSFLNSFRDYINSHNFTNDVNNASARTGVPPRRIAENFIEKVLGTIGDVLGIGIGTIRSAGHTIVSLLSAVLNGGIDLICNVASAIANMLTLNKTAAA